MKLKRTALVGMGVLFSLSLSMKAHAGFPENNLHLQDNLYAKNLNMTEAEFRQIIDETLKPYQKVVKDFGAKIKVVYDWKTPTVNASAYQQGTTWVVHMYGGLARRPEVTNDGFALVVCHELGHHIGGFPFYEGDWAASEGQSDYFAAQVCARKVWGAQHEINKKSRSTVHPTIKAKCDAQWTEENDQNLCYRIGAAGQSLADLLGVLGFPQVKPSPDSPSKVVVRETEPGHPEAQCRLDTYMAGGLCRESFDSSFIPGKDHARGQDSLDAEMDAAKVSCTKFSGHADGLRPTCWYKPRM